MFIHDAGTRYEFACEIFNILWILMGQRGYWDISNDQYSPKFQNMIVMSHNFSIKDLQYTVP